MTHSYDPEVAVALGDIAKAVVLKEIACRCRRAEGPWEDAVLSDGRRWTPPIPIREWQSSFPEIRRIGRVLAALCEDGWLISRTRNSSAFDHARSYALSDKSVPLLAGTDSHDSPNESAASPVPAPSVDAPARPTPTEKILKERAADIERLYRMYPGKTMAGNRPRSTGKCSKDRQRIAGLLKTHTAGQIERSITKYLEETGGRYLKDFSTFLNNLPEYEEEPPASAAPGDDRPDF